MTLSQLWLVRHGESAANVAASAAERRGLDRIEVPWRDADVPLTDLGGEQAVTLGEELARGTRPDLAWSSPYVRARTTAEIALGRIATPPAIRLDERLRDRELGVLDLLTSAGVRNLLPDEDARRRRLGKLSYRPPGGESWYDVAARVRSFLRDADEEGGIALLAVHDAVIWLTVFVCCRLDEDGLFALMSTHVVANASITRLERDADGGWRLAALAETAHLEAGEATVTLHQGERSDAR